MATSTGTNEQSAVSDLSSWYKLLFGSSGTTSTETTSSNITDAAVQAEVNSILTGSSGVAAIANATKGSGLYNSSTQSLLTKDLVSTAAAKAAALKAGTTTTRTTGSASGLGKAGTLGLMGLNALAKSRAGQKLSDTVSGKLSDVVDKGLGYVGFGGSSSETPWLVSSDAASLSDNASSYLADTGVGLDYVSGDSADYASSALSSISDFASSSVSDAASSAFDWAVSSEDIADQVVPGMASMADLAGFACGGRVPKAQGYASGGRVKDLYSDDVASAAKTYTANALGKYSSADNSSVESALSAAYGNSEISASSNADGAGTYTSTPSSVPGQVAMEDAGFIGTLASKNGGNWESAREEAQNLASKGISAAINTAGYGLGTVLGGLFSSLGLGTVGQLAGSYVGGKAQTGLISAALTNALTASKQSQYDEYQQSLITGNPALGMESMAALADARESKGYSAIQDGYYGYQDYQSSLEAQDATTSNVGESNGLSANESMGPDGQSVDASADNGMGTSSSDDTSGWGGFSSEDSTSYACGGRVKKAYAKGGRVVGDLVKGVDDVKAQMRSGTPIMLDGGEGIITAKSMDVLDKTFGTGFLDMLNSLGKGK